MYPERLRILVSSLFGMLLVAWIPLASASPHELSSMDAASAYASEVWEQTHGRAYETRRDGVQRATTSMGSAMTSIDVYAAPAFGVREDAGDFYEFGATMSFAMGSGFRRAVAAYHLQADAVTSAAEAERWAFVSQAQALYADYQAHAGVVTTLQAERSELEALARTWGAATQEQVASLDVMDLEAELTLLSHALVEASLALRDAESSLQTHLGQAVTVGQDTQLLGASASASANPWAAVHSDDAELPELRALEARARQSEAEALRDRARQYGLSVGAYTMWTGQNDAQVGPIVALSIPIAPAAGDSVAIARAEAIAIRTERELRAQALTLWMQNEASLYDTLLDALQRMEAETLPQLEARLRAIEAAHTQGHLPAQRLLLARRDLLEAQRQAIRLRARLATSHANAAGIQALMETREP